MTATTTSKRTNEVEKKIQQHFKVHEQLGQGAYGIVWKVVDRQTQETLALKKCFDSFRNDTDAQRTYREIKYLKALKGHTNIVHLKQVITSAERRCSDIYLAFDYMPTDLHVLIRAESPILLDVAHHRFIVHQLLKAMKYIHSAGLIHRDIKPSNILVDSHCHVKVCDFGLCRSINELKDGRHLTDYVATRWYRSPEILLGSTRYTTSIDMWSIACILGEMMRRRPLIPGNSTMNQIEMILKISGGMPSKKDMLSMKSPFVTIMLQSAVVPSLSSSYSKMEELSKMCGCDASPLALDFMRRCMRFNPEERCSAQCALEHPFVIAFNNSQSYAPDFKGVIDVRILDVMCAK